MYPTTSAVTRSTGDAASPPSGHSSRRAWRRRAVALARLDAGEIGLDVGVGTGDLAFELLRASATASRVVGVDLSEEMLTRVRRRAAASPLGARFEARAADAQALPFADA